MQELKRDFPPGVDSIIVYDPTIFIAKSIREVVVTIFVAILLVVAVVFLFLQSSRATIHSGCRNSGVACWNLYGPRYIWDIAEQPVSIRPCPRGRYCRRRCDRCCRKHRAQYALRNVAVGSRPPNHGRSRRGATIDRIDALRRLRAIRLPLRHLRTVLPSVRGDDCRLDGHLLLCLADAQPGALRRALQGALRA